MLAQKLELLDEPDDDDDEILEQIEKAIKKEEIRLPAMPDIVMKIREAFKDEQYDIVRIARIIQSEPGLAAYILKIANSPLHRGPMPIRTAKHAICRLGQNSVQNIVLTYTMRSLFETKSSALSTLLQEQWEMSTHIAAISAILAERFDDFDPDQAMLGGLLQDIGTLPLIDWLKDNHSAGDDIIEEFKRMSSSYAAKIGEMIVRSWQFAPELIEVVANRGNWTRDHEKAIDTTDIVCIARHHYFRSNGLSHECPEMSTLPAYQKLPFQELSDSQRLVVLEEAQEQIKELHDMLMC